MGFWDVITGRTRPKQANLDALFAVPTAALTMQTSLGLVPTGDGAVCYRAAAGAGFAGTQHDIVELLGASEGAPKVTTSVDEFGFTWLSVDHDPLDPANPDITGLVTDLHAVNTTLEMNGFGPGLLCSLIAFTGADGRSAALIYLYKQGTFYPFVPTGPQQRDNLLEINIRTAVEGDLPVEKDLSRWLAVWGAPGL
ncbi:hypothetical protein ACIA03_20995 [Nocardioides sp. NPDC051685]|uniref:PspA-associated protein PspAB n=1 Tax=Nocardioides sp. NPDC051685 TaxID=3364334 RepID=UPI0037B14506